MKVSKKEQKMLSHALLQWQQEGKLSEAQRHLLSDSIEVIAFDWTQIARYSFGIAITCLLLATLSILFDDWLIDLIQSIFDTPDIAKSIFFAIGSSLLYLFGIRRKSRYPEKTFGNEAFFVMGMISTAIAIFFLGRVIESDSLELLILFSALIYGVIGLWIPSQTVWGFSLIALGCWFSLETYTGWESYFFGMNYPLRFALFGTLMTVLGHVIFSKWQTNQAFQVTTKTIGLFYLFCSLYLLSIFGNYANFMEWRGVDQITLLPWSALLLIVSLAAFYHGVKSEDEIAKGFGIAFVFINLYTRFFEFFWEGTHKALFFAILGLSFWLVGSKAERIYHLRLHSKESE